MAGGAAAGASCCVCGGTDLNLVDGYYYCVECGTQDATMRETVVEYTAKVDGTFARTTKKRITILLETKEEMSAEWYKWHTFNFILSGLADELVLLGAGPSFKVKLLWIWSKYIQRFRKDDDLDKLDITTSGLHKPAEPSLNRQEYPEVLDAVGQIDFSRKGSTKHPINIVTMKLLQTMIYVALNLDESDIQLSDLIRFVKEDRLSCRNCLNLIPKDLKYTQMDFWINFSNSLSMQSTVRRIRGLAMSLFNALSLGAPVVPNLHKLVDRYVKELCLPIDFRDFVFSLMKYIPVDLEMRFTDSIIRIPDYEGFAMAYIVVGLKMCFGLDGHYENVLSDAVISINAAKSHDKAYKHNLLASTDRLFSFRQWSIYIEHRKHILSKFYFPVAVSSKACIDPQVFISHTMQRVKVDTAANISDEVMMEILDRIVPSVDQYKVPKIVFPPSVTPLSTYTDVLLNESNDFEMKELLSEDFTQYSLKYVTEKLDLTVNDDNVISGISIDNIVVNEELLVNNNCDRKQNITIKGNTVFARHWDNDSWLNTKPPTSQHVKLSDDNSDVTHVDVDILSLSEFDHAEAAQINDEKYDEKQVYKNTYITDNIDDKEDIVDNIFNDDFYESTDEHIRSNCIEEPNDLNDEFDKTETPLEINYDLGEQNIINKIEFDEAAFDREEAIEALTYLACKEYHITTSVKRRSIRRKTFLDTEATTNNEPKTKKRKVATKKAQPGQVVLEIKDIYDSYFAAILDKNITELSLNLSKIYNELNTTQIENENAATSLENAKESNFVENNENDDAKPVQSDQFDKKKYDTTQLYLKVNKDNETTDEELNKCAVDPDIADIFSKTVDVDEGVLKELDQPKKHDEAVPLETRKKSKDHEICSDDDDIPLNVAFPNVPCSQDNFPSSQLVDKENFGSYWYWCRHELGYYDTPNIYERSLNKNYPKSFVWVLRLCASLIENQASELVEYVASLEMSLKLKMMTQPKEKRGYGK